jgi:hypothetical protein
MALAKRPEERVQSCRDLSALLGSMLTSLRGRRDSGGYGGIYCFALTP